MIEAIHDYHDQTKHHFHRYARSPGYLDWANQPNPFREYIGAERIDLPLDVEPRPMPYRGLYSPQAGPPDPMNRDSISLLLRYSLALSAWKQSGPSRWALRINPSSGNLHPTEAYLVTESFMRPGSATPSGATPSGATPNGATPSRATLYHYTSARHALERRAAFGDEVWRSLAAGLPEGSLLLGLTSILWREAWKYGERAFRYCQHDVGHALAAVRFSAAMLGWKLRLLSGWSTDDIAALLGTDRHGEFTAGEHEEAELLVAVVPHAANMQADACPPPSDATLAAIRSSGWFGRANQLSNEHVRWPSIDAAAMATRKPRGEPAEMPPEMPPPASPACPESAEPADDVEAHRIVFERRSAVDMDGASGTSRDVFFSMLARTLTGLHPPWDICSWSPKIDLVLFAHRVEGLVSGLYVLVRDPARFDRLQGAMRKSFEWQRPAALQADLPLYLLQPSDCRNAARQLSCHQAIAADGFFSLGMLAEFAEPIRRHGAWFYRHLFWEAGMVGQVLYLEAEAWGARATGIGCYFDDAMHDVLGLRDREFQSLYHFTVGVPVEDTRLRTWPPYSP